MAQLSKYRSNKTRQYPRKGPHLFSSFGSFHRHSVLSSLLAPVKPPGADLSYLFASLGAVSRRLHGLYWKDPLGGSRLSELSRTVFAPNGHDSGEVRSKWSCSYQISFAPAAGRRDPLPSFRRRRARGAGGAESVETCTKSDGMLPRYMLVKSVRLGAPSAPFLLTFGVLISPIIFLPAVQAVSDGARGRTPIVGSREGRRHLD